MSNITVDGRATADAELRFSHSGQAILSWTLAENHRKKVGDQWQDDGATFYRVTVFGKRAESLAEAVPCWCRAGSARRSTRAATARSACRSTSSRTPWA